MLMILSVLQEPSNEPTNVQMRSDVQVCHNLSLVPHCYPLVPQSKIPGQCIVLQCKVLPRIQGGRRGPLYYSCMGWDALGQIVANLDMTANESLSF